MRKNLLTVSAILVGSSIAVWAGCFVNGTKDCPALATYQNVVCELQGPASYPMVKNGQPPSTSGWTAYVILPPQCEYLCVIDYVEVTRWYYPGSIVDSESPTCNPSAGG